MKQFRLHFDGGCKPNPGQGYGSYELESMFQLKGGSSYKRRGELIQFGFMTNNVAEYQALLHGLKALWHDSKHGHLAENGICPKTINLLMFSDSKLVVEQMSGRYKVKVNHIRQIHEECRLVLKEFGHWNIKWNPRRKNVERFGH